MVSRLAGSLLIMFNFSVQADSSDLGVTASVTASKTTSGAPDYAETYYVSVEIADSQEPAMLCSPSVIMLAGKSASVRMGETSNPICEVDLNSNAETDEVEWQATLYVDPEHPITLSGTVLAQ